VCGCVYVCVRVCVLGPLDCYLGRGVLALSNFNGFVG
jgi:hypothetical protein